MLRLYYSSENTHSIKLNYIWGLKRKAEWKECSVNSLQDTVYLYL